MKIRSIKKQNFNITTKKYITRKQEKAKFIKSKPKENLLTKRMKLEKKGVK